jgi:hypothetical protein
MLPPRFSGFTTISVQLLAPHAEKGLRRFQLDRTKTSAAHVMYALNLSEPGRVRKVVSSKSAIPISIETSAT